MGCLEVSVESIKRAAVERGLIVFPAWPSLPLLGKGSPSILCPLVEWDAEDCGQFLDFALQAAVSMIYADGREFRLDSIYREALEELTGLSVVDEDIRADHAWCLQRFEERVGSYRSYDGKTDRVGCMWFSGGVAHRLLLTSAWSDECCSTIDTIVSEILDERATEGKVRSAQEALRIKKLADQLARHERFPEATSEAKREFMAKQLFPKETGEHRHLAELASLIYWWDVEPQERTTKAERARELHRRGESIRNIAAMLKLPESKVRAAISAD